MFKLSYSTKFCSEDAEAKNFCLLQSMLLYEFQPFTFFIKTQNESYLLGKHSTHKKLKLIKEKKDKKEKKLKKREDYRVKMEKNVAERNKARVNLDFKKKERLINEKRKADRLAAIEETLIDVLQTESDKDIPEVSKSSKNVIQSTGQGK